MKTLQKLRLQFHPALPTVLHNLHQVSFVGGTSLAAQDSGEISRLFPLTSGQFPLSIKISTNKRTPKRMKLGVVFSGGQAPGGHTVIAGVYDALKILNPESTLWGFIGGPSGILQGKVKEITGPLLESYRNQGGFDLLGSGRTKIETKEQLQAARKNVGDLALDGLVIIGGDDSNTNAAVLAEYFLKENCPVKVIGVPKTIDGDLQNEYVRISFGFDTACKVYAEMIGNINRDSLSSRKYTHFIKLMGRSASHIAIECALSTHPNLTWIGEEVDQKKLSLSTLVAQTADLIQKRAEQGKNYGVILVPEGLIEFIPEMKSLIRELNQLVTDSMLTEQAIQEKLSVEARQIFTQLPEGIRRQFITERDPHGNVQVSLIETERLLVELVTRVLKEREKAGVFKGKFSPLSHFFGYEGRSALPSNFDAHYSYSLGYAAALLIDEGATGYMAYVQGLHLPPLEWCIGGVPIAPLLCMEERKGKRVPVIRKALVDLKGKPFTLFTELRDKWALDDDYHSPGPIQFYGDPELTETPPLSLVLSP